MNSTNKSSYDSNHSVQYPDPDIETGSVNSILSVTPLILVYTATVTCTATTMSSSRQSLPHRHHILAGTTWLGVTLHNIWRNRKASWPSFFYEMLLSHAKQQPFIAQVTTPTHHDHVSPQSQLYSSISYRFLPRWTTFCPIVKLFLKKPAKFVPAANKFCVAILQFLFLQNLDPAYNWRLVMLQIKPEPTPSAQELNHPPPLRRVVHECPWTRLISELEKMPAIEYRPVSR